jgi:aminopeptidase N
LQAGLAVNEVSDQMRTETPVTLRLDDYAPYPFTIEQVALDFDLDPAVTQVRARLVITPLAAGPMRLDGEGLTLKTICIDPQNPAPTALDPALYALDETGLTLLSPPPRTFVLETLVEISPAANTALSGLYMSGGRFCTQCEAVGFRRITFYPDRPDVMSAFSVRMAAEKTSFPILLSNGTPGASGDLGAGRHFATWDDPHKKPAYLFALCAGAYDVYSDQFTTMTGETVGLAIHVDTGEASRAAWAMDSLKRAMRWDEEVYGRAYDLGVFNIVAVRDFNFGAMENKGLNVFNSAYVLADAATATDADFEAIESIVAHEYFHNWTGNRITCRDWFQLCLKEGLTVFRDQNFSADMRSAPVQRIKDVIRLRARQFPEDQGPLAHAVRPATYAAIDNLYTATVYEKGAELIGMLRRMIGDAAYRTGMDLYFDRHDGQAVTIEDFYACFEAVTGRDFSGFRRWYAQPGTPEISVTEMWDASAARLTLHLVQSNPVLQGAAATLPLQVPLLCALIDSKRQHAMTAEHPQGEWLLDLNAAEMTHTLTLPPGAARPLLSINRAFSAPVKIARQISRADNIAALTLETDAYCQWDAAQTLITDEILMLASAPGRVADAALVTALAEAARSARPDPAFAALLLRLPDVGELFLARTPADPVALDGARRRLQGALYAVLAKDVAAILQAPSPTPYAPTAEQAGIRALRGACITLLGASPERDAPHTLLALYEKAPNMTERLAALRVLAGLKGGPRTEALQHFEALWSHNPLVMDKWFSVQAASCSAGMIAELTAHPAFDLKNPNRVRAVIGVFATQNLAAFHAPDGSGYAAVEGLILQADQGNPALAARLLTAFEPWSRLEPKARAAAQAALLRLQAADLSANAADIVSRTLGTVIG